MVEGVQSCLSWRLKATAATGTEVAVKGVCGESFVELSSKQDECSGCAAFVVPPSGCFLRKLLWPVRMCCWFPDQKVPKRNCVYLYVAQLLPEREFVTSSRVFLYFVFPASSELCTTLVYVAQSINTPEQRTGEQQQSLSKTPQSLSPVVIYFLGKWCHC